MQNKTVFIIAGEVSGDCLGARIMHAAADNIHFIGIGGENMTRAGLKSIFPMSDLAVMGISEVIANAKTLKRRITQTVNTILETEPNIVLTIDSPGFARAVVSQVRKSVSGQEMIRNGLRFYHVVAPQVWAWRPKRAKKIAKTFDRLYTFFDFEVPYFTKYGLDTVSVGHPIADAIIGKYEQNKTPGEKIITLIPGSRMTEVKKLMPLFHSVVKMLSHCGYTDYKFVIPTVETTDAYIKQAIKNWEIQPTIIPGTQRYEFYSKTYIALAASGTVSAELAMMHVPAIIVYKMNRITTLLARILLTVKWVSLVNILLKRGVYPELLGPRANVENIMNAFCNLTIPSVRKKMISDLESADNLWRKSGTDSSAIIAKSLLN